MKTFGAREAKNNFGQLMDEVQRQPVTIEKHGRPVAVIFSMHEYRRSEKLKLRSSRRNSQAKSGELLDSD